MNNSWKKLSKKVIEGLAGNLCIVQTDLFAILGISAETWQLYADEQLMSKEVGEKALQLIWLYKEGEDVFGNPEKFQHWMNTSNLLFQGKKPIELLDTRIGFQVIQDELTRIDYGVLP